MLGKQALSWDGPRPRESEEHSVIDQRGSVEQSENSGKENDDLRFHFKLVKKPVEIEEMYDILFLHS